MQKSSYKDKGEIENDRQTSARTHYNTKPATTETSNTSTNTVLLLNDPRSFPPCAIYPLLSLIPPCISFPFPSPPKFLKSSFQLFPHEPNNLNLCTEYIVHISCVHSCRTSEGNTPCCLHASNGCNSKT